jgi:DNA invertase Pin-like site-specific DNA recombinase
MKVGYVRVSAPDQNPARQLEGVELDMRFEEYASAKSYERPKLLEMINFVRDGDEVYIHSLDRAARNVGDARRLIETLNSKNVPVHFVKEGLSFRGGDSPVSVLMLNILVSVAEFERALILERQREGIAIAKKKGAYKGARCKWDESVAPRMINMLNMGMSIPKLAQQLDVTIPTVYKYMEKFGIKRNKTNQFKLEKEPEEAI